ncbi:MAG: hypothetical protein ACLP1U_00875 [Terracidiphilus sp.]
MSAAVLLYCAGINYAYVQWVSQVWVDLGFTYNDPDRTLMIVGYVLAATQCTFAPSKIWRPSQVIYWFLYFIVYIPGLFIPLYLQLVSDKHLLLLQLSMSLGMLPIALSYRIPLPAFRRWPLAHRAFWTIFSVIYLLGNAILLITFRGMLHFASIQEIYSVRYQASEVLEKNVIVGYVTQLLGFVMNPVLIAYGLVTKRYKLTALGTLGQIVIYMTAAAKSELLSPLVILIIYLAMRKDRGNLAMKMGLCFAGILFALTAMVVGKERGIIFNTASVVLARSFETPGMLLGQYQYFFENNPHTHLGNVHGVNLFVGNPYTSALGIEVGRFFGIVSAGGVNGEVVSNASFFAMDGIAGFGLPGIPLMGLICAFLFWVLDGCAKKIPIEFSVSGLAMIIISLTNVSLFTTFLGNGLLAWMLLFLLVPTHFFRVRSKV